MPCSSSSFPRRRESIAFALARHSRAGGNPVLDLDLLKGKGFRPSFGRASHFSCSCKKSNQKNTPQRMSPSAHPALRVRVRDLCSADCTSLCKPRNRRDPSRRPCGHRGLGRRHAMGPGSAARVVRAEAKQQQEQKREQQRRKKQEQKGVSATRLCSCLRRARRAPLLLFRGPIA